MPERGLIFAVLLKDLQLAVTDFVTKWKISAWKVVVLVGSPGSTFRSGTHLAPPTVHCKRHRAHDLGILLPISAILSKRIQTMVSTQHAVTLVVFLAKLSRRVFAKY